MLKEKLLFISLFWVLSCNVYAQEYYFKHFKVEDGLSHNTVLSILQDSKGFMWFGTKNGLNRFDGYNFKVFQNDPESPNSLLGNYIDCLHEFQKEIWVGTDNGLFKYNDEHENFSIVKQTKGTSVMDITHDDEGYIWFISNHTLRKLDYRTGEITTYPTNKYFLAYKLTRTKDGSIVVVSSTSLYKYDKENNSFITYEIDVDATSNSPFIINQIYSLTNSVVLLGTKKHGVISFDIKTKQAEVITPLGYNLYVRDLVVKGDDQLWIATESGIYILNMQTGEFISLHRNPKDPYALSDNAVYCLSIDDQSGVWAGTYFGGISYCPKTYTPFKKFIPLLSDNSISGTAIREIHEDDNGNLWIGSEDNGLSMYNPRTDQFTNFNSIERGGILKYHNIHGIMPIGNKVWVSMFENGIDVIDINQGKVVKHYNIGDGSGLESNFVFTLYQTRSGEIFVITTSGIQKYLPEKDHFVNVEYFPASTFYTSFLEDKTGTLWAGTYSQGLYYYNPTTKQKGYYNKKKGISHKRINGIFQDSKENLWITTENGLNLYDPVNDKFHIYHKKDGFPSNVFYSIEEDENGILWISTGRGLVRYDRANKGITTYTKGNGLLGDQFNYNSSYQDDSGRIYMGTVSGLISFNPKDFVEETTTAPIYLTGLQINNRDVEVDENNSLLSKSIMMSDKIQLNNKQSSFSINFATLSYPAPQLTNYWYQLKGLSQDWISLNTNHKVYFTELAPGDYNFRVKSKNTNGVWSTMESGLTIEVLPPIYASKVAYLVYFLMGGALIYWVFRYYHRQLELDNIRKIKMANDQKEKEVYQAKIEFFTNVSHEIRTPLTLILNPLENVIKSAKNNNEIAPSLSIMKKNTKRLLDLVNQLLDFRKTEMDHMKLSYVRVNFTKLLKNTISRFSETIEHKGADVSIDIGQGDLYAYLDKEAVMKIVSNLLNNAIKHGEAEIRISLERSEDSFTLRVSNDGNLIPTHLHDKIFEPFFRIPGENKEGTGIGLSLAHSLAKMHQGSLDIDRNDKKMNTFILQLPLYQDNQIDLYNSTIEGVENKEVIHVEHNQKRDVPSVLLVEDNVELLNFMESDMVDVYRINKATSADLAFEVLQKENIHIIVSDIAMEGMDGFSFCQSVKTNLETSHIPVILLTAKSSLNSKIQGLESGADAYIEKPFSIEHLKSQIANLLSNRSMLLQHYSKSPLAHLKSIANTKTDHDFVFKLEEIIDENLANPEFNVEIMAEMMNMSRSTLYRKINDISDLSPNDLINVTRLKKAAILLKTSNYKVYEVSEIVGYNTTASFGRNFHKQFNMTPSKYMDGS